MKKVIVGILILGVMVAPSFFVSADSDQTPVADEILRPLHLMETLMMTVSQTLGN